MAGEAVVAGAAGGGSNLGWLGGPWGMALSILAPTILGSIFGQKGVDANTLRQNALAKLTGTAIENERAVQLANLLNSPALAAAQAQAIQGGQAGAQAINARLGQTGLGRSGVGMALEGAVRAAPDVQLAMMKGQLANEALNKAIEIQQQRANAELAGGPQNSLARDMMAATVAGVMPSLLNAQLNQAPKPPNHAKMSPAQLTKAGGVYGGTTIPITPTAAAAAAIPAGNSYARPGALGVRPKPWSFIQPNQPVFPNNDAFSRHGLTPAQVFGQVEDDRRLAERARMVGGFRNAALRLPPAYPTNNLFTPLWYDTSPYKWAADSMRGF